MLSEIMIWVCGSRASPASLTAHAGGSPCVGAKFWQHVNRCQVPQPFAQGGDDKTDQHSSTRAYCDLEALGVVGQRVLVEPH